MALNGQEQPPEGPSSDAYVWQNFYLGTRRFLPCPIGGWRSRQLLSATRPLRPPINNYHILNGSIFYNVYKACIIFYTVQHEI